jgi:prophage maintenance system killer protein
MLSKRYRKLNKGEIIIYKPAKGEIELKVRFENESIWLSLNQIAELFGRDKSVVSRHLRNIFKENELIKNSVVAKIATTATDGKIYQVEFYNLDAIISVGYRVNSQKATQFRIWATKTLKHYLIQGYTINKKRIGENYNKFMRAVSDVKALLPAGNKIKTENVLELISTFADTWFSLNAYDKDNLPQKGARKKQVAFTAKELKEALEKLKENLIRKKEAAAIFGRERNENSLAGIVGNVFQSISRKDIYPTPEEKAAHLLYFIIKDHPFVDGNKRSGAFVFIWFLRKARLLRASLTPEALTTLTLLLAESSPKDKNKMVGLVLLLLDERKRNYEL